MYNCDGSTTWLCSVYVGYTLSEKHWLSLYLDQKDYAPKEVVCILKPPVWWSECVQGYLAKFACLHSVQGRAVSPTGSRYQIATPVRGNIAQMLSG